jgi:hypothetical protein
MYVLGFLASAWHNYAIFSLTRPAAGRILAGMRIIGRPRGATIGGDEIDLEVVGEVTEAELADLDLNRPAHEGPPTVQRLRDTHHGLARALAAGNTQVEAGRIAGYTATRVYMLMQDPAFQELVASYRALEDQSYRDARTALHENSCHIATMTARMVLDKLTSDEEAGDLPSYGELGRLSQVYGDISGMSATKVTMNTNVNANLGDLLAAARARAFSPPNLRLVVPPESPSFGLPTEPFLPEANPVSPPNLVPKSEDK